MRRREFIQISGKGLISTGLIGLSIGGLSKCGNGQKKPITARQIIERIQKRVAEEGVEWNTSEEPRKKTVDVIKTGSPDTVITGIATTFMSTFDVLQRAAASGKNFIITHEPTFWNHSDNTANLVDDPLFQQKMDFIQKNNLVIWRFHDHIHLLKPDFIFQSFSKKMGWESYIMDDSDYIGHNFYHFSPYEIPETTLGVMARDFQKIMGTDNARFIGDPGIKVRKVGHGIHADMETMMNLLSNVDAVVVFEGREWNAIEYVRDMVDLGHKKGLILLSHENGEEWGMKDCADWLREFIPEVPIEWISAGDHFWTPELESQL